jgi:ABC-2 type transport system permease protein
MIEQTLAIIRNTFFESIRQPIMLVLLVVATIALILSNPLAAFTMDDDQRMLVDMGLATVFVCGTILAAFIATSVLTREIENRTALTVVSKPVPRPLFILGKYLGVAAAIGLATIYMGLVFMLVELQPVRQTVRTPFHMPVIVFTTLALVIGAGVGVWCNFFYNRVFASTVIAVTTPLLALAYVLSLMFSHDFTQQAMSLSFKPHFWMGFIAILMAILVLTAVAIAASTRLSQVLTLCVTLAVFMVGMLSDWFIGRPMETLRSTWLERARAEGQTVTAEVSRTIQLVTGEVSPPIVDTLETPLVALNTMAEGWESMIYGLLAAAYAIVPNFQRLLLMDALTQQHVIPPAYLGYAVLYGLFCIIAALTLAVILFQRREVG